MKRIVCLISLVFIMLHNAYSQDYIIRNNNKKTYCRISTVTNTEVSFSIIVKEQTVWTSIAQEDIKELLIKYEQDVIIYSDLTPENRSKIQFKHPIDRTVQNTSKTIPTTGGFIEIGATSFFINGNGYLSDYNFTITKDWMRTEGTHVDNELAIYAYYFAGFGMEDKVFLGVAPRFGYRFSPKITLSINYSHYKRQQSSYSNTYESYRDSRIYIDAVGDLTYSQRSVQLLFQFTPSPEYGFNLIFGPEFLRMKLKATSEFHSPDESFDFDSISCDIDGSDISIGIDLAAGLELPVNNRGLSVNAYIMYAVNNYKGSDLFKEYKIHPIFNPPIQGSIKLGGLTIYAGLRKYF